MPSILPRGEYARCGHNTFQAVPPTTNAGAGDDIGFAYIAAGRQATPFIRRGVKPLHLQVLHFRRAINTQYSDSKRAKHAFKSTASRKVRRVVSLTPA